VTILKCAELNPRTITYAAMEKEMAKFTEITKK